LSRNLGNLTSRKPLGHSRPVTGLLYLYLTLKLEAKCLCYNKFAGIIVFITVFRYDGVVTLLLLKFVNPRLGICSPCWALEPNPSVISYFHMMTFIKLL
jgi:hypothetical protein